MAANVTCNICKNNKDINFVMEKNGYNILKCPFCGVYLVNPQPDEQELRNIYSFDKDYFKYTYFSKKVFSDFLKKRLGWLSGGNPKNKKFLDVGCGTGEAVFFADKIGFNAIGLEINEGAIKKMREKGVNVKNSTLEKFNGKGSSFDAIYLGDIIEHVKDPSKFLDKCCFLLKKGGRLLVATPNTNCFLAQYQLLLYKLFGIPWGHVSPPYHLFEFSNKSLIGMLKSKGFETSNIEFHTSSFPYSVGNTGLFKDFKNEYRKSRNFFKVLKNNDSKNNMLLGTVILLFYGGYLFNKFLKMFSSGGNAMTVFAIKK